MNKYIDADRLIRKLENSRYRAKGKFIEMINEQEAANVQEVRHGRWKGKPIAGYSTVRCSVCEATYTENNGRWSYCPNCGARMDLDDNAIQHTECVENALGALDEVTR